MSIDSMRHFAGNALWRDNPDFTRLLALCPLLVASDSFTTALWSGMATMLVMTVSSLLLSLLRKRMEPTLLMPGFLLLVATLTTCIALLMQAYAFASYQPLALFIPLIIANCLLPSRNDPAPLAATLESTLCGLGFALLLIVVGVLRAWLGTSFLLALLPPGAFLLLGLMIALKNLFTSKLVKPTADETTEAGSKRAKVTGKI